MADISPGEGHDSIRNTGNFWEPHPLPCVIDLVSSFGLLAENNLKPSTSHHSCLSATKISSWGLSWLSSQGSSNPYRAGVSGNTNPFCPQIETAPPARRHSPPCNILPPWHSRPLEPSQLCVCLLVHCLPPTLPPLEC